MKLLYQTLTVLFALALIITASGYAQGMFGIVGLLVRVVLFASLTKTFASLS